MLPAPLGLLERSPPAPREVRAARPETEREGGAGGALRCRLCGHPITSAAARTQVAGAHEHERMNPAGIAYLIGCFRAAPGCVLVGTPSTEFSWFPPHAWRVALCGACLQHLGWAFVAAEPSFFGLILERLAPG